MLLYADRELTSPYAMSVFVALTEKSLPFEVRTLDPAACANNEPDYALISLTQRVPTLIDGDFALSELLGDRGIPGRGLSRPIDIPGRPENARAGPSATGMAAK